jgi:hypothetical protein
VARKRKKLRDWQVRQLRQAWENGTPEEQMCETFRLSQLMLNSYLLEYKISTDADSNQRRAPLLDRGEEKWEQLQAIRRQQSEWREERRGKGPEPQTVENYEAWIENWVERSIEQGGEADQWLAEEIARIRGIPIDRLGRITLRDSKPGHKHRRKYRRAGPPRAKPIVNGWSGPTPVDIRRYFEHGESVKSLAKRLGRSQKWVIQTLGSVYTDKLREDKRKAIEATHPEVPGGWEFDGPSLRGSSVKTSYSSEEELWPGWIDHLLRTEQTSYSPFFMSDEEVGDLYRLCHVPHSRMPVFNEEEEDVPSDIEGELTAGELAAIEKFPPLTYVLDERGDPLPCDDTAVWCSWFEDYDRTVGKTAITPTLCVSTVFLGLDHKKDDGPPVLWESQVISARGIADGIKQRYTSRADAEQGHEDVVRWMKRLSSRRQERSAA